jgi:hypothetical protein
MPQNFTTSFSFDGRTLIAVVLPAMRRNGMHYEVNVAGYPRFFMKWSELDRYDIVDSNEYNVPDSLVLAVSDAIEREVGPKH